MVTVGLCKCEECPLDKIKVFGEGMGAIRKEDGKGLRLLEGGAHYDVAFVGMAPAKEELIQGRPFVGPSGRLFRTTVDDYEYPAYYVTNTLLCEIPYGMNEKEVAAAVKCCQERLFEEIRRVGPSLVVALGNMPLEALCGKRMLITKVSGKLREGRAEIGNTPVLPVEHPASILRRPMGYSDFCWSMEYGVRWLSKSVKVANEPTWEVVTPDTLGEFLRLLKNHGRAAIDIETTKNGLFPYVRDPDKIRCIGFSFDKKHAYIVPGYPSTILGSEWINLIEDEDLKEVMWDINGTYHNGMFDCGFLMAAGYKPRLHNDTMLMHYMMDERGKSAHGLKKLAYRYLGAPEWELDIGKYLNTKNTSYDNIPDEALHRYLAHDVCYTEQLESVFEPEMVDAQVYRSLMIPCANMFTEIRHKGIKIDVDVLMKLDGELREKIVGEEERLRDMCGFWVNPASPKQAAELVYDILGLPETEYGRTTEEGALEIYRSNPYVKRILEYRGLAKLRGAYVDNFSYFVDNDWRIHPLMKMFAAVTGRIASEDPAVFNIPKEGGIKRMFLPEKGHELLECDQRQMELRWYALIGRDKYLESILYTDPEQGGDPHKVATIEYLVRAGIESSEKNLKKYRRIVKTGVFGRLYGRGLRSIMNDFGISWDDANELVQVIDALFPSILRYNNTIKNAVHHDHVIESYFGRKRRFKLITEESRQEIYRQALNHPIQSAASDLNLYLMLHLYYNKEIRALGINPLFPVHDSIVFDIESREGLSRLHREMRDFCYDLVKHEMIFDPEMKIGSNWEDIRELGLEEIYGREIQEHWEAGLGMTK